MALDFGVILLILLAAALHASWNALVKAGGDTLVMQTLVIFVPSLPCLVLIPLLPLPAPESWLFLAISTVVHYLYYYFVVMSYRHGDLSQVYPIARGAAPALVAIGAWFLADESLSPAEWLGVSIVCCGIISLAWRKGALRDGLGMGVGFALLNSLTIATYLVADGLGIRRSGNELAYIAWLFPLEGVPLLAFTLWRRWGRLHQAFMPHIKTGLIGGVVAGLSYGIALWTMTLGPLAHIVALRETSVVMAAIIGTVFLAEPFGRRRILAAALVALGAVLLNAGL